MTLGKMDHLNTFNDGRGSIGLYLIYARLENNPANFELHYEV